MTSSPRSRRRAATRPPTKPVAPVTTILATARSSSSGRPNRSRSPAPVAGVTAADPGCGARSAATLRAVPTLLLVHHSPSDAVARVRDALVDGATDEAIDGVELVQRPALEADADDVLAADAVLLLTTANFGYMSGALKHFFDTSFPRSSTPRPGCPTRWS
jgi:hypothetical protein